MKLQTQIFFKALDEWDQSTPRKEEDEFKGRVFSLVYKLGGHYKLKWNKEEAINSLKERVEYIINECKIDEDFVIMGLVNLFHNQLKHELYHLGEEIVTNERMLNTNLQELKDRIAPEELKLIEEEFNSPDFEHPAQKALNRLKSCEYINSCKINIQQWEIIRAKYFNQLNRELWEDGRMFHS